MSFLDLNGLDHYKSLTFDKMVDNIAPVFSASKTYGVGDYVMYGGALYQCIAAVTAPGAWNGGNWIKYRVMTGAEYPVYGVEWDYSQSSPVLTRTDDAAGLADPVPAASLAGSGSSPFDGIMPWAGIKRYNLVDNVITCSEDDAGFSEEDYDTLVYIPEFYYKAVKDEDNSKWTWQVSPYAKSGFKKHPGSGRYLGRFHVSGSSEELYSKAGTTILKGLKLGEYRALAREKGSNVWMMDYAIWSAVQILYLIEFATFDSQSTLGTGVVYGASALGGTTDAHYHTLKASGSSNLYRWIENPNNMGTVYADGMIFQCQDETLYISTDNASFNDTAENYTPLSVSLPESRLAINKLAYVSDFDFCFIPEDASASDYSTYVTDRCMYSTANTQTTSRFKAFSTGGAGGGFEGYGMFSVLFTIGATHTGEAGGTELSTRLMYIPAA